MHYINKRFEEFDLRRQNGSLSSSDTNLYWLCSTATAQNGQISSGFSELSVLSYLLPWQRRSYFDGSCSNEVAGARVPNDIIIYRMLKMSVPISTPINRMADGDIKFLSSPSHSTPRRQPWHTRWCPERRTLHPYNPNNLNEQSGQHCKLIKRKLVTMTVPILIVMTQKGLERCLSALALDVDQRYTWTC